MQVCNVSFVIVISLLMLSACSSFAQQDSVGEAGMHHHLKQWQTMRLQDYDLLYQKHCYCLPDHLRSIRVEIRNGEVAQALFVDTNSPVVKDIQLETISTFFELIDQAQKKSAYKIEVDYDSAYGYPKSIDIDYHQRMVDDEIAFSNIKVVKK